MDAPASLNGLVLAGGRSSRFGADKALALFDKRTLLHLSLERFSPCQARAVAVRSNGAVAAHARALGASVVDDPPDAAAGPLAGIAAGLEWASANEGASLAIVPCDAPLLRWRHYQRLFDKLGDAPAAFATSAGGDHPLCAIWRCHLLPELSSAMADGRHPSARTFLRSCGARAVRFEDAASFANVNTKAELAHIARETAL